MDIRPEHPLLLYVAPNANFFLSHRAALASAAREEGYRIAVACPNDEDCDLLAQRGYRHVPVPLQRAGLSPPAEMATLRQMAAIFRSERPAIAHLITAKPALYGGLAARLTGTPSITAVTGLGFLFMRRTFAARILQTALLSAYRIGLRRSDNHFIFQNTEDRDTFERFGLLDRSDATVLPGSGTDLRLITPAPMPTGVPLVVMPSRMLRDKGVDEFIAAAKLLVKQGIRARFRLVGDPDPENPTSLTRQELQSLGASGPVEWQPFTKEIGPVLAQASIVALPSYREGFPKTLIDAAAAGRSMVTTDVPGCRDAVIDGKTGFLCKPKDAQSLADAMRQMIENPGLRQAMGEAARRDAEARFDIADIVAAHLALYRRYRKPVFALPE